MAKVCIISSVHNALDGRIFYREACSLQLAGYKCTIIAIHDQQEIRQGILILPLKRLPRFQRPLLWWKILRLAIKTKADVFHIHDPELLLITPFLRLLSRKPVIYDVHEAMADFIEIKDDIPFVIRQSLAWIFRWLEPFLARMQSGLIFADDQIANTFGYVYCPKTTLFNFPVDSLFETASHTIPRPDTHQPIILYLGGLKRNRGTSLMLNAFKCVLEVVPQAKLFLVGPFAPVSLEAEMRSSIAIRTMSKSVNIIGAVPFDQVDNYLAQASIGWIPFPPVPKYQKNIPTKLFEYMAYSIPVVSSDLYPVRLFIENNKTGMLVNADDPSAHAKAIITLLTNPSFASSLGKNGQKKVSEQYRWSLMEKRLLSFYADILDR